MEQKSPEHFPRDRITELNGFKIAAKSGTAQIAVGGKYKEKGTTASLLGFFPADAPRFLVFVKLNEPEVRPWGSDTSGPIFFSIIRDLAFHFGMTP
jgi:cell division protein FtsI/penicillin-binding protein 2